MKLTNENYISLFDNKDISLGYCLDTITDKSYLIIRIRHTEYVLEIPVSIILNILVDGYINMKKIKLNRKKVYKINSPIEECIEDINLQICSDNIHVNEYELKHLNKLYRKQKIANMLSN